MFKYDFKMLQQKIVATPNIKMKGSIVAISIIVVVGILYWVHAQRYIDTDNAYVNANIVQIAPQVNGQVIGLHVQNNQFVKAGTLLFELDPTSFQTAVDKMRAQLAIAEATLKNAQANTQRIVRLVKNRALSIQEHDDAMQKLQIATATLQRDKAFLAQAELDLRNSKVYALTSGYVSNMSMRIGNVVSAFHPLFAIISDKQYWVDANFKETELQNIKPGQVAKITIDMYPSIVFKGVVESISGGSGAAFSLLPPQNATGNWIKITQRVPVKIHVLNPDSRYPLRIGTTAAVTIDTREKVDPAFVDTSEADTSEAQKILGAGHHEMTF